MIGSLVSCRHSVPGDGYGREAQCGLCGDGLGFLQRMDFILLWVWNDSWGTPHRECRTLSASTFLPDPEWSLLAVGRSTCLLPSGPLASEVQI